MQKRFLHSLVELAGQKVKAKGEGVHQQVARKGRWVMLPPLPPPSQSDGLLLCLQEPKQVSAIAWLKRCCPQISQNDAETLFRSGQVKIQGGGSVAGDPENFDLKRVSRKEILSGGAVLCLPTRSLQSMNVRRKGRRLNAIPEIGSTILEGDKEDESEGEL